jgi:hypothetical protein
MNREPNCLKPTSLPFGKEQHRSIAQAIFFKKAEPPIRHRDNHYPCQSVPKFYECINGLIIECRLVMTTKAGIQEFFKLVPGTRALA